MPYITCHHCYKNFDGPRRRARRNAHEQVCGVRHFFKFSMPKVKVNAEVKRFLEVAAKLTHESLDFLYIEGQIRQQLNDAIGIPNEFMKEKPHKTRTELIARLRNIDTNGSAEFDNPFEEKP